MVFAKLWALGVLVAVLIAAATPPLSAPVIVRNELPAQGEATPALVAQPCPDTATAQIAAAEERINDVIERNRQETHSLLSQADVSAVGLADRLSQLDERLRIAENQAAERKADTESIRSAMMAPLVMTWALTALAAVLVVLVVLTIVRARRERNAKRDAAEKP